MAKKLTEIKSNIQSIKMANYSPTIAYEREDPAGYVKYGARNDFPQYLINLYHNTPDHGALCTTIAYMIAGKGFTSPTKFVKENIILPSAMDLKIQGGFYWEIVYSKGGQIAEVNHLPFEKMRLDKQKFDEEIEEVVIGGAWYSRDWRNTTDKINKPEFIPKFDPSKAASEPRQVYWQFVPTVGSLYYPRPDYFGAVNYIELAQQISIYHVNNILNGLFPSFIINMNNGIPDPEKQLETIRQFENKLSGAQNAGKFIMTFNETKDQSPEITPFPLTDADKQYEFLSEESTRQIMRGHRVTTPLAFGIRDGGGFGSNKDEMIVGMALFQQYVIEPYQRMIVESVMKIEGSAVEIIPNVPEFEEKTAAPVEPAKLTAEKKKIDGPTLSDQQGDELLARFAEVGETCDLNEWDVVEESFAGESEIENEVLRSLEESKFQLSAEQKSKFGDSGLYKLRYRYSTNIDADSRKFCQRMVDLSVAGVMYRKEDIDAMSDAGVNGTFAPEGQSTYDIFKWKGGCFCHHKWVRLIFVRKRSADGKILPASKTEDLENDKRVGSNPYVPKKGDEGVAPINTPSRGSLKYG